MSHFSQAQSAAEEDAANSREIAQVEAWLKSPRWQFTERPYDARDIVELRGSVTPEYVSNYTAKKLWALLRQRFAEGAYSHTFGALDTIQAVQMAAHLETVYVSGWQCSSTASTTNEPGPDFADYPSDTVPCKVDQLFRAQLYHDRKQREARSRMSRVEREAKPPVDYLRPMIADGDTGHGGLTTVMKMMKLFVERGAAGVHIEDQKPGVKKCGHMGGKVLVPVQEQVDRLIAARLQCDVMGTDTLLVARTDADAATLLDSNADARDHPYIVGATTAGTRNMADVLAEASARGASADDVAALNDDWVKRAGLKRYPEAVEDALRATYGAKAEPKLREWRAKCYDLPHSDARALATTLGVDPYFDWEAPRSREGFYRVRGGTDYSIARARAYAPHCDLIWMETSRPSVAQARDFADGIHATHPHQMLAYNLSPSFNWDAAGMNDAEIANFQNELGRLGFTWHFITLAGFHSDALIATELAREYGRRGILAYVELVQREEHRKEVDVLTHQRWSGAELADRQVRTAQGGVSSTSSMGAGVTETQFAKKKAKL